MISVTPKKIDAMAAALRRAAEERGRPCVIGTKELLKLYAAPGTLTANDSSRVGRSTFARVDLHRALGGRMGWGCAPTYDNGLWSL